MVLNAADENSVDEISSLDDIVELQTGIRLFRLVTIMMVFLSIFRNSCVRLITALLN